MRSKALVALFVTAGLLVFSTSVFAHHAAAGLFSPDVESSISGTVKQWLFVNPHPALIIDIKNAGGSVETWRVEFAAPRTLTSNFGWTRNTMKPGDQVKIIGYPYFGNKKTMFAVKVTIADGKEYVVREPRGGNREGRSEDSRD